MTVEMALDVKFHQTIKDWVPAGTKLSTMVVCGGSMRPFFRAGQMVAVREAAPETIKKGNVILFSYGDDTSRIMHRVIDIVYEDGQRRFLCRGDNRSCPDSYICSDQILGKVVGRYRNGQFKPFCRRHEYGGLILAGMYRRVKSGAGRLVLAAWPLLSRWFTHTVTVQDHCGRDRDLVFVGWGNLRFARNFNGLAERASAGKQG